MKRLLLLRHAKTERDNPGGDHARILTERGIADATLVGGILRARNWRPDHVLCSTAARTTQTWEIARAQMGIAERPDYSRALYLASSHTILGQIQSAPDFAGTLLIIGHNPGMEDCAIALVRREGSREELELLRQMREKYPTSGLSVFEFPIEHWRDVRIGEGQILAFLKPRDARAD